ncbi:MAG: DoxX family protein [Minisyncoccia bacterium]
MNNTQKWASVLLRVAMALVFIWFGTQQLMRPEQWTSFIPAFINFIPAIKMVVLNGWFEVVFGVALLIGFYTRLTSFLLALHLLGIAFTVGLNALGVRDFGLALATFSIFLNGADFLSLDNKI